MNLLIILKKISILEFIYYGTLVVPENELNSLIKSASSLGVYGLNKLNADSVNESKNDQQQTEINNNNIDTFTNNSSTNRNQTNKSSNKEQSSKNDLMNNKSNQQQTSSNKSQDKNKKKVLINNQVSEINDLEEKRKKKEIISQTTSQTSNQITNQSIELTNQTATQTTANQQETDQQQSTAHQSASKRQSLRIRHRKNNPTKEQNAFDLLNTSNNSDLSISEISSSNGRTEKRLRRTDSDSQIESQIDDLMSIDGSEYNTNKKDCSTTNFDQQNDNQEIDSNNDLLSVNRISINKTMKLKRNKHSILKKQTNEQSKQFKLLIGKPDSEAFNILSKRQLEELDSQSNQVLSDDEDNNADLMCEENIILKKLESATTSPTSSLNASRKNSIDSNNELLIKLNKNEKQPDLNESSTSTGNQSLLAKQQIQKKKRRRSSLDNDS